MRDRRAESTRTTRPVVVVRYEPDRDPPALLRDIAAGLEEEGVPFRVEVGSAADAVSLAHEAAHASPLDVGVGVGGAAQVCVHHAKLPPHAPALLASASAARAMGHNAARLVTGIPLKLT